MKNHFFQLTRDQLIDWLGEHQQPSYRADQILKWAWQRRASGFHEMSDLPKRLREQLEATFQLWSAETVAHPQAEDGTEKLLLQLADRGRIECVLLRDGNRRSICISSQVGCAMGCVFCASGLDGVDRNLTQGELVEQMLRLQDLLPGEERLSHIVVMGMGEPLANLDNVLAALQAASSADGLGISPRRITISTVGLPSAIDRLCGLDCRYNLAVSLHAPNDELRNELVPANKNTGLERILAAADRYFHVSGRRLTFEYVLLGELNDRSAHAHQLGKLLQGRPALLNVIPYNPVAGLPYQTPTATAVARFRKILQEYGVNVQFRQRKGDEINAACGQLRRSESPAMRLKG